MVSLCGRGFDSLQLHFIMLQEPNPREGSLQGKASLRAERDSLQLHFIMLQEPNPREGSLQGKASLRAERDTLQLHEVFTVYH